MNIVVTGKQCMQAACVPALHFFSGMVTFSVMHSVHALSRADTAYMQAVDLHCCAVLSPDSAERLKHLHNVEMRFYCPQAFLS